MDLPDCQRWLDQLDQRNQVVCVLMRLRGRLVRLRLGEGQIEQAHLGW